MTTKDTEIRRQAAIDYLQAQLNGKVSFSGTDPEVFMESMIIDLIKELHEINTRLQSDQRRRTEKTTADPWY